MQNLTSRPCWHATSLCYQSRMHAGDRNRRLGAAIGARYTATAPAPVLDADLAILSALIPRRQKRRTLFLWLGLGAVFGISFVGCTQATTNVDGFFPIVIGLFLGIVVSGVMFALRGAKIDLRTDKLETARALLRRIDFAAGQPINMIANLSPRTRIVASHYKGPGMWTNASRSTEYADEWLFIEGRVANGIGVQVTRSSSFGATATRHSYVATATTMTDTVTLTYPLQMNAALASSGPSVAQHIQRPPGANVEVMNQPGSLSVRMSHHGLTGRSQLRRSSRKRSLSSILLEASCRWIEMRGRLTSRTRPR